jgi:hypothetical protein
MFGALNTDHPMTKSEIVVSALLNRHGSSRKEKEVRKELVSVLSELLLTLEEWDKPVNDSIGQAIIRNLNAVRGELSMKYVIRDIDTVLKRISG